MNKILVTGGSGFIGTNLIEVLKEQSYEILNLDIAPPKIENHRKFWRRLDINNFVELEQEVSNFRPNHVVHLAARTDLNGLSIRDYETNTTGFQNLLFCLDSLSSVTKLVAASSMLVCKAGYLPRDQFDYCPDTVYGKSKVDSERLLWNSHWSYEWLIFRPTSIWGPWFGQPYKRFFELVQSKSYFHIGNRGCTKTYGYVENVVEQILGILFYNTVGKEQRVFYVGDYEPTNIETWANEIADTLGYRIKSLPFFLIRLLAAFGDFLKLLNIQFPMTSFRLRNMTTDNVIDLHTTMEIVPRLPVSRTEGIRRTLNWMKSRK